MEKTTKRCGRRALPQTEKEAAATRKSTFAIIFVLQKGKAREDGTAPIVARITVNHEMVHFATRMYIHPDRWLPKDYRTAGKSREEKQINDALDELRVLIRRRYDQMLRGEETITAAMLKTPLPGSTRAPLHFWASATVSSRIIRTCCAPNSVVARPTCATC